MAHFQKRLSSQRSKCQHKDDASKSPSQVEWRDAWGCLYLFGLLCQKYWWGLIADGTKTVSISHESVPSAGVNWLLTCYITQYVILRDNSRSAKITEGRGNKVTLDTIVDTLPASDPPQTAVWPPCHRKSPLCHIVCNDCQLLSHLSSGGVTENVMQLQVVRVCRVVLAEVTRVRQNEQALGRG